MRRQPLAWRSITLLVMVLLLSPGITSQFVARSGGGLLLDGRSFRFAGTNTYYLMYASHAMTDDVIQAAAANNLAVLRTWGWLDIGNQDGSETNAGAIDGVYLQYWDGTKPAYNDGDTGLKRLDYAVYKAGLAGLKLVIPLTNNWNDFGGMDQYVRWRDGQFHDEFYTDDTIRAWYKGWVAHMLNHTNSYTGVRYKDDPTIMTWELANEPRCIGTGRYPASSQCSPATIVAWADEMSRYVKSIDAKHLVSVGDEGFYCEPGNSDKFYNCSQGDALALATLPNVDVLSLHVYPDIWERSADWATAFITRHMDDARALGKPVMIGEFGWLNTATRNHVYRTWTDAVLSHGGSGALYWLLAGTQDDGTRYPDHDGFTVYADAPVFRTIGNFGRMMAANRTLDLPPVADDDTATTTRGQVVTIDPAANDLAYNGATLVPESIDVDLTRAGQQTTLSTSGGTFALEPNSTLRFVPAAGFAGTISIYYTIRDTAGRESNRATITVAVR